MTEEHFHCLICMKMIYDKPICESCEKDFVQKESGSTQIENIDFKSYWYQNCKQNRSKGSKCCLECPFRAYIEAEEAKHV